MNRRELIKVLMSGGIAGIPAVNSVKRLDAGRDDIIVLKVAGRPSHKYLLRIKEASEKLFAPNRVVVFDGDVDMEIIRRTVKP